jgi:hypothetical protein
VIHEHKNLVDCMAALLALIAGISLSQLALTLTVIATIGSISLIVLRWHDRIKYGPPRGRE